MVPGIMRKKKFPYKIEIIFPIGGNKDDRHMNSSQIHEVKKWLDANVGCEDIRWNCEIIPLSYLEQKCCNKISQGIFRFKLETAATHFKTVWG